MPSILIPVAVPVVVDPAVSGVVVGNTFVFAPTGKRGDFTAVFQATGTVTTITAQLEISLDGGTTWAIFVTGANFFPTNAQTNRTVTSPIAGALYRINYTAASGTIVMRVCSN